MSLAGYYFLLDLGIGQAIIKFVAEKNALKENEEISKILNASIFLQLIIGMLGALLLIVFAKNILHLLNVSSEYLREADPNWVICCLCWFFLFISYCFFKFCHNGLTVIQDYK